MLAARPNACLDFANPDLTRADQLDKRIRAYRQYARNHYPNLLPEVLSQIIMLERGIILSEEDVAQIITVRDTRVRKQADSAARTAQLDRLSTCELVRLIWRRLGL